MENRPHFDPFWSPLAGLKNDLWRAGVSINRPSLTGFPLRAIPAFTGGGLTEGNEGNEEGGRPTYLVAVGIAAVGHASVTVLGRSGHFLELGSAKRDCVWPRRRGERGFCGRRLFDGVFPCPLGLFGRKGPELGLVVGLAMVAICFGLCRAALGCFIEFLRRSRRNYAIALCLSELALRANELVDLTLDDVDWRRQTLRLRQTKQRRQRLLPLPSPVARALADYPRRGRPVAAHRAIFVRHRAPVSLSRTAPSGSPVAAQENMKTMGSSSAHQSHAPGTVP